MSSRGATRSSGSPDVPADHMTGGDPLDPLQRVVAWRRHIFPLLILLLLLFFVVYPAARVIIESLAVKGNIGLAHYRDLVLNPYIFRKVWSSVLVAVGSACTSTLLGLVLAITVMKTALPLRRLFAVAAITPMILPSFVTALAYVFLVGRNGLLTYRLFHISWEVYSWRSVLILQSIGFTTITFLLISAALAGVDSRVEDAARNLGAGEWSILSTVTLPLVQPAIIGALLLVFLRSMADFGTPLIVGGRFDTLASASYNQLIGNYDMGMASAMNVVLLVICLGIFPLYNTLQDSGKVLATEGGGERKRLSLPVWANKALLGVSSAFTVAIFALVVSVFLAAFTKHIGSNFTLTLDHFRILPQQGWNSIRNTLLFAGATCVLMSLAGIIIAYIVHRTSFFGRRLVDLLATLPFAIPGTFMGIGFAIAFSQAPLVLSGTWTIIIICTVVRELPLGVRAGISVLMQMDHSLEDISANLGASRILTFFRIVVPQARYAILVSALYAFVASVKTLGAIIFLITPFNKVLAVDVFEATLRGEVGDAAALSIVMILVAVSGILAIYCIHRKEVASSWMKRVLRGHLPV